MFDALHLQPFSIVESLMQIIRSVIIYGFQFTKALEQVLTESLLLGMHTGIVHLAWSQSDNEVDLLKGCKYVWTHCDRQPWGQPLPILCPLCRTIQKWSSIYLTAVFKSSWKMKNAKRSMGIAGKDPRSSPK